MWTIHDELNALLQKECLEDYKRKMHDMVLMSYLRELVQEDVWPRGEVFAMNAPFVDIHVRGAIMAYDWQNTSPSMVTRDLLTITLEKKMVYIQRKPTPIWTYRGAFVQVALQQDWKWLRDLVIGQLIDEEFEELKEAEDEVRQRASYYLRTGQLMQNEFEHERRI